MSWSHPSLEAVALVLGRHTGLSFAPVRQASAEQGIRPAMRRLRATVTRVAKEKS